MDRKEAIASLDRISKTLFFLADFLREEAEKEKGKRDKRTRTSMGKIHTWWVLTSEQIAAMDFFLDFVCGAYTSAREIADELSPDSVGSPVSALKKKVALGWKKVRYVLRNRELLSSLPGPDQMFFQRFFLVWPEAEVDVWEIEEQIKDFLGKDTTSIGIIS